MYPKDKYLIPVAVPAIVVTVIALNNDPLPLLVRESTFWRDAAAGIVVAAAVWLSVRQISIRMDGPVSWKTAFYKRLLLQAVFGWALPSLLLFGLCWVMFDRVVGQPIFESLFPYYEYPFCVLLIAGMNAYYLVSALLAKTEPAPALSPSGTLFAYKGADMYPLHRDMIRLVVKNEASLDVYTADGERLNMSGTLENLEKQLPGDLFFRVNRQVIMHVRSVRSFRAADNGKIEINCTLDGIAPPVVSQKKAPGFRKWLDASFPG